MATKSATDVDKQVGARLRARRQAIKMAQTALAEALGITFQQVQKYEKGLNRISTSRLAQIAATLDAPITYFFEELGGTAETSHLLSDPEVVELVSAFRAIENKDMRRALVNIALIMSGTAGAQKADATGASSSGRRGKAKASS